MSYPSAFRRRQRCGGTLFFEVLEDRCLPSTNVFSQSFPVERPTAVEPAPQGHLTDSVNSIKTTLQQTSVTVNEPAKPAVNGVAPADATNKDFGARPDNINTDSTLASRPVAVNVREVLPQPTPRSDNLPGPAAKRAPNVAPPEKAPAADPTSHQRPAIPVPVVPVVPPVGGPALPHHGEGPYTPPTGAPPAQAATRTPSAVVAEAGGAGHAAPSEAAAGVGMRGVGAEQSEEAAPAPAVPALYEREVDEAAPVEPGLAELAGAVLPFDRAALDAALQQFLGTLEEAGQVVGESWGGLGPAPWLAAVAAGVVAYEVARRRTQARRLAFLAPNLFPRLES